MRVSGAAIAAFFVATASAHADVGAQCRADALQGEKHRADHDLRGALYAFRACSAVDCPEDVRSACIERYDAAAAMMPSLIVHVHDATGRSVDAHVIVDGQPAAVQKGGSILLDPGAHAVRVDGIDGIEQQIVVHDSEKRSVIFMTNGASETPPPAPHTTWPWVVTSVGGAGVVVGAVLTAAGVAMYLDWRQQCRAATSGSAVYVADVCNEKLQEARDGAVVNHIGIGLLIGGAVVAGVGLLWHFVEHRHGSTPTVGVIKNGLSVAF